MNNERLPIEDRIGGFALSLEAPPDCPVCGGRSIWWCSWYSPKGNEYLLCARCDAKASDEEYFKKIIKRLDELEERREHFGKMYDLALKTKFKIIYEKMTRDEYIKEMMKMIEVKDWGYNYSEDKE